VLLLVLDARYSRKGVNGVGNLYGELRALVCARHRHEASRLHRVVGLTV